MNPSDYKFEIGDLVITTFGEIGHIKDVCECEKCIKRGFHEPTWIDYFGDRHYITDYDAYRGFDGFYRIGKYRFNKNFEKPIVLKWIGEHEDKLNKLKRQMNVIEGVERGWIE